jgi:hypothetical protein
LAEFVNACSTKSLPLMVGGDINIIRNPSEKNNERFSARWPALFNACIESLNLRELELSGCRFTWVNNAVVPTVEKLDRILVSTDWEQKFPLSSVEALNRELSDHTPLLLDTCNASHRGCQMFKFELSWLTREGFHDIVTKVWREESRGDTPMKRWQSKIRAVRRFLRGWARNVVGDNRNKKCFLLEQFDLFDVKAESHLLNQREMEYIHCLSAELTKLHREEELYWLTQGDNNTKYFHLLANGRHRKTQIIQLQQEEGIIVENDNLKNYITNYYKFLFGPPENNLFRLDEQLMDDIPQVLDLENEILSSAFSETEMKEAVFHMENNKAPGSDGFP